MCTEKHAARAAANPTARGRTGITASWRYFNPGRSAACHRCVPCNCRLPEELSFSQHLNTMVCLAATLRLETKMMVEPEKQSEEIPLADP